MPVTLYLVRELETNKVLDSMVVSQKGKFIYQNGFFNSDGIVLGKVISSSNERSIPEQLLQIFGYNAKVVSFEIPPIIPEELVRAPERIRSKVEELYNSSTGKPLV